jgi:hypothetical protein
VEAKADNCEGLERLCLGLSWVPRVYAGKGICESQSSFYGVFSRAYVGCPVYTLCMERLMLFNIYNITLKKKKKKTEYSCFLYVVINFHRSKRKF